MSLCWFTPAVLLPHFQIFSWIADTYSLKIVAIDRIILHYRIDKYTARDITLADTTTRDITLTILTKRYH